MHEMVFVDLEMDVAKVMFSSEGRFCFMDDQRYLPSHGEVDYRYSPWHGKFEVVDEDYCYLEYYLGDPLAGNQLQTAAVQRHPEKPTVFLSQKLYIRKADTSVWDICPLTGEGKWTSLLDNGIVTLR